MDPEAPKQGHRSRPGLWWLLAFAAGFALWCLLLFEEHAAHLTAIAPWLILLLCPLMHLYMHRHGGHGDHGQPGGHSDNQSEKDHDHGA